MSIYKNKFVVEKEFYGLFQKELYFSRKIPYTPVVAIDNGVVEIIVVAEPVAKV